MDSLHGNISGQNSSDESGVDFDRDEDVARELPPVVIGQDERRMQVRAYNFWASLLVDRNLPSIEDLDPDNLPDFGPNSVLLDFSLGIENPAIVFLGAKLAMECGATGKIETLSDVPSRSLLSRITDHHLQIIANQAPIGFEAEFVNERGATIMYRGILLPFSSDGETIDFIFGVINWKELADQQTTDNLLKEIDQALDLTPEPARLADPITDWADGPGAGSDEPLDLVTGAAEHGAELDWPEPEFASPEYAIDEPFELTEVANDEPEAVLDLAGYDRGNQGDMELADWLASAREYAALALGSEDRSRAALYAAISRAFDFSLAAAEQPENYAELITDAGLTVQDRAPMTPLVKLVFGATYDKTRLTEYAAVLGHGHRLALARGAMADYLAEAPGGLKGLVASERKLRRDEIGAPAAVRQSPRERLARKLRKLDHLPLAQVASEGSEFTLLVARRLPDGAVVLLGEVADDALLLERAARRLIA
jgi:hypothetical protein